MADQQIPLPIGIDFKFNIKERITKKTSCTRFCRGLNFTTKPDFATLSATIAKRFKKHMKMIPRVASFSRNPGYTACILMDSGKRYQLNERTWEERMSTGVEGDGYDGPRIVVLSEQVVVHQRRKVNKVCQQEVERVDEAVDIPNLTTTTTYTPKGTIENPIVIPTSPSPSHKELPTQSGPPYTQLQPYGYNCHQRPTKAGKSLPGVKPPLIRHRDTWMEEELPVWDRKADRNSEKNVKIFRNAFKGFEKSAQRMGGEASREYEAPEGCTMM